MSFLRLFLLVFFVSFCGDKKSEKNPKDESAQKKSEQKSNDFVYIVEDMLDLPTCDKTLEKKVYFIEEENILKSIVELGLENNEKISKAYLRVWDDYKKSSLSKYLYKLIFQNCAIVTMSSKNVYI